MEEPHGGGGGGGGWVEEGWGVWVNGALWEVVV